MTKTDFSAMLESIQMDEDAKKVFMAMPREEQLAAILGIQAWTRSELVNIKKEQIQLRQDFNESKKESLQYRIRREKQEKRLLGGLEGDDEMSTTQKIVREIKKEFSNRFDFWIWFRDKVLPSVAVAIVLGLLYLLFGKPVP